MKHYLTLLLFTILLTFSITACADRGELIEVDRESITDIDVFDVERRGIEGAVRHKYWTPHGRSKVESVTILSREAVGATSNWFSGNALYYEVEYEVIIVHYEYENNL